MARKRARNGAKKWGKMAGKTAGKNGAKNGGKKWRENNDNRTVLLKKCKQLLEYQHLLLLRVLIYI
jgi:hypothetical protein